MGGLQPSAVKLLFVPKRSNSGVFSKMEAGYYASWYYVSATFID